MEQPSKEAFAEPINAQWRVVSSTARGEPPTVTIALDAADGKTYRFILDLETCADMNALVAEAWGRYWLRKVHSDKSCGTPSDSPSSGKQSRDG